MPKNLLFIMTDHQRADSIGMEQCGRAVTPALNRLAAQSRRFTRAYTTCPLCVPARTALATGRYPTANGVTFNDWQGRTAGEFPTTQSVLRDAGYRVAQIGVNHVSVRPKPRELGLTRFYDHRDYEAMLAEYAVSRERRPQDVDAVQELVDGRYVENRYSNSNTAVYPHPPALFKDNVFTKEALSFLDETDGERPFALFLYLWAPHPPLTVPPEYAELYDPQAITLPANVGTPAAEESPARRRGVPAQLAEGKDEAHWRRVWAAHLGLVSYADMLLGQVIDRAQALDPDCAILFTVDHGEALGQHRMYQKMEMYEPSVRIPLLLRAPGLSVGETAAPVSHLDVLPTLCALLELPRPAGLEGISLLEETPGGREVFSQYSGNPGPGAIRRMLVGPRYKYVWDEARCEELYDLESDPLETRNIARENSALCQQLHARCRAYHLEHGDDPSIW